MKKEKWNNFTMFHIVYKIDLKKTCNIFLIMQKNMSSSKTTSNKNTFNRGGRGRGRGRRNNMRRDRKYTPMRQEPKKPKTELELLRESNMSGYVRRMQEIKIREMTDKYALDELDGKVVYLPRKFSLKDMGVESDVMRNELMNKGWEYENGEFKHPYTEAKVNLMIEKKCCDGRILVPGYELCMDDEGVSTNIVDRDGETQYFSDNTYKTVVSGDGLRYSVVPHEFNNCWDSRRGKRLLKKFRYMDKREKKREEYNSIQREKEKKMREYEKARKQMRG